MLKEIQVPDIGDVQNVDVIEVLVAPGDRVKEEGSLITLESEKATTEIPSPDGGTVHGVSVKVGDKVSMGDTILILEVAGGRETAEEKAKPSPEEKAEVTRLDAPPTEAKPVPGEKPPSSPPVPPLPNDTPAGKPHATPSVRGFARELGVDLTKVKGSGPKGRILKEDIHRFVKSSLSEPREAPTPGMLLPEVPVIDFSKFGEIETQPLTRIKILTGANVHRSWLTVPQVTQFDEADITDLEEFRQEHAEEAKRRGFKLTLLAFLMKACVVALARFPNLNASLDPSGENLIVKKYYHIGVAVDTPEGLVVPVVRDVDQKGLFELAEELGELGAKARERKLTPAEMQGGSFTISSLGGIGGTFFTPIVNAPQVAILGVSRAARKPLYSAGVCSPRLVLPFSLSYDHRVIDGAEAVRFTTLLGTELSDIRNILL